MTQTSSATVLWGEAAPLERALSIAREAHAGQTRRHGAPYIEHPRAVLTLVDEIGAAAGIAVDEPTRVAALLHDVVEDSDIPLAEIGARFGDAVARRVDLLTKPHPLSTGAHAGGRDEHVAAYFARLREQADDGTRLVKVCDRLHNLSELHLAPDSAKLGRTVDETLAHVVPLAAGGKYGAALVAALHDGIRAACRAQGVAAPADVAAPRTTEPHTAEHLALPMGVYAVVDGPTRLAELLAGGVALVQLRNKGKSDRAVLAALEEMLPLCRKAGVPLIVNDRADLCVAAGADGVHVGQHDLPPAHVRRMVGERALVGSSSHTDSELFAAADDGGSDHVAVGPVFASPTKQGHAPVVGLAALARRAAMSKLPVVAIGGITTPERVIACAHAGAHLVAAVSALAGNDARTVARRMALVFFAARAASARASSGALA